MKLLSLDISSHTGWSVFIDNVISEYGLLEIPNKNKSFPFGIHEWSKTNAQAIVDLIIRSNPDKIIIERSNSSRFRESQNFLDFTHCFLIDLIIQNGYTNKLLYRDSSAWRKIVGIKLTKEQQKQNRLAKEASKKKQILKINGKRKGKITKKHLAILKVKEIYNIDFKLKQNDIAESILLGYSYIIQQQ